MSKFVECKGKTKDNCSECGIYFSSHSLYYNKVLKENVSEISCSIGGTRKFDEQGNRVD